ncbi:MAG: T9SS type A sorting domain-containing protein [Bacteroidetes bacterium]|nr:T9SS type A sorting domain-containing protein [Bacteroidota bacterium]
MNANCIKDSTDFGLSGWMVRADPGPVYAYTNNTGYYYMYLDSGNYTISLVDNDPIRQQVCPVSPSTYNLSLDALPDTVGGIDFSVHADEYCPDLNVDIRVWGISPCRNNSFYVFYCNNGTSPASAIVEVELDNNMSLTSYYPYSYYVDLISQLGNILTFDVGTLFPEQCGHFKIRAYLECDMSLVGNTKCVTAHIYPDSSCFPADTVWDKSSVAVEGNCVDDSLACFTVYNTGDPGEGDMDGESEYRIYENNTLVYTGTFQIPGGDSLIVCRTACGNTIRLEADQRPDHPGNSHPQDNVEMCGDSDDTFVTGQITVVPEDDEDDFISIDCQVVVASYDPNDKQVMPEGLTEQFHFIDSTYTLEYTVHFQNTGTDTAFKVVIRDTLSPYLDITTIELGTSSHDYTFEIFEGNILQWTFDSIILPDSNVNEPESHGFVKFGIHQKSGNEIGTVIENKADIVFDYNEPVMTNTVFNTVGSIDSIVVNNPITFYDNISVKVYPNPFHLTTTFEIHGINRGESFSFELYNILGKQVSSISGIKEEKFVVDRENLPTGIYIYKIFTQNGMVSAGRLLVI